MIINEQKQKMALVLVSLVLCAAVLALDLVGIKILGHNNLGFKVHCYSYGITFLAASGLFTLIYWRSEKKRFWHQALRGVVLGIVWWALSFVLLLYFHGIAGGTM